MENKGNRASVEKKMELAQYIREENMGNRMKIRQREQILYGRDNPIPLWGKQEGMELTEDGADSNIPEVKSTFKFRMVIAIMLFIGFLLCDTGDYQIFGYSMNDIYGFISEDYFQVYENSEANDVTTQLSRFLQLDFEK